MKKLILIGLLLSACTSSEEIGAAHEAQCKALGFTPGTAEFGQCFQREEALRLQRLQAITRMHQTFFGR